MPDPRYAQLASLLTRFSTKLQPGENVLLDMFDTPPEMTVALVRAARAAGAFPYVQLHQAQVTRELLSAAQQEQYDLMSRDSNSPAWKRCRPTSPSAAATTSPN